MSAEYLIMLPDGSTDGPYSEEELLDMVDADELGAGTVCLNTETLQRCRVRDLFKVIPPEPAASPPAGPPAPPAPAASPRRSSGPAASTPPARWVPAPLPPEPPATPPRPRPDAAGAGGQESASHRRAGTSPAAPASPPRLVHAGHPSFWIYWRSLLLAALLMGGGWYAGRWENGAWWMAGGWLAGGAWLALTLLRRSSIEYRVTTFRVEVQRGFFSKSSQEIRIPDIRAMNVTKSGFPGLLGVGDLSFSSAAGDGDDVLFRQTAGAHRLKNRIRRLQDRGF